ncbi:rhodanese-like domain-containing protein [Sphingorhabdus sp. Alg239-R122]|uniref:rhodanese-like domain-containing protein n=1 Tax=Sphingorhabdus sp. Alg239-R122 TaxID=2305989 RepID=UPI0013DD3351|nr:rhodanese-like domain-containing protein [Sphingorhabdus sp. Alg239-R122]
MLTIRLAAALFALLPAAAGYAQTVAPLPDNPQVDYAAFAELASNIAGYRQSRLVGFDDFQKLAGQKGVLVLDTRSAAAFAAGHIEGAVNLPFPDFTDEKLANVIGDTGRTILIYCNNNFSNDRAPVVTKRAPLALNIPTFINLYGYGYRNIYELNDVVDMDDSRVRFVKASRDAEG